MHLRRTLTTAVAALALPLAIAGLSGPAGAATSSSSPPKRLVVNSTPPVTTNVDVGTPGVSDGDYTTFHAQLSDASGKDVGWLYGTKTLIAAPGEAGMPADRGLYENLLTFRFTDGGTIVVGGVQTAALSGAGYGTADPGDRAIIGGTGRYAGVKGVLSTSANPDGSRHQVFRFTR